MIPHRHKKYNILIFSYFFRCYFILFLCLLSYSLQASHYGGGTITYEHISYDSVHQLNEYKITLSIIRICISTINFEPLLKLGVYEGNSDFEDNYQELILYRDSAFQINPTTYNCLSIPNQEDYCLVTYSNNIMMPVVEQSYHIIYQDCCRTSTLSNVLLEEDAKGFTYQVEITGKAQHYKNNGPFIDISVPITVCAGESFSFSLNRSDFNQDSIAYQLFSPLSDGTINNFFCNDLSYVACPPPFGKIQFIPPLYDEINQLGLSSPINIHNGIVSFTPELTGLFLIGIDVTQYRNQEILSRTIVDLQVTVVPCVSEINLPEAQEGCNTLEVSFEPISNSTDSITEIEWSFGDGRNSTEIAPHHIYNQVGEYSVNLLFTSLSGCMIDTTLENLFTVRESPNASFSWQPNVVSNINSIVNLNMDETISNWEWTIDDIYVTSELSPYYTFLDTGIHKVQLVIMNEYGCTDTSLQFIDVVPFTQMYIPNSFSPNSDGINDVFIGQGLLVNNLENYKMEIYNRWGGLVFQSFQSEIGWNGTNNKEEMPTGIYIYRISFLDNRQNIQELKGEVVLLR